MISTTVSRAQFVGAGLTGPYAFAWRIFAAADLLVTKRTAAGAETTLSYGTEFTLTTGVNVGDATGSITLTTALAVGETLTIRRAPALTQPTSLQNQAAYFGKTHEDEFDRLTAQMQGLDDRVRGAFSLRETYDPASYSLRIPPGTTGQVVGWDSATQLGNRTLDAGAIAIPGENRTVATLSAYIANNAVYNVVDYGAVVGASAATNKAAITAAMTAAIAAGGGTVTFPARDLDIGNLATGASAFSFTGAHDLRLLGYGCRVICNTTDSTQTKVFAFLNSERIYIEGIRVKDNGADLTILWKGCLAFWFRVTDANTYRNISLVRCGTEKAVAFFTATSYDGIASTPTGSGRIRNILLDDCFAFNTYYGINCQDAGDNLRAPGFRAHNFARGYFPYGVEDHDIDITCSHDAGFTPGVSDCVLFKRYYYNTRNIRVRCNVLGTFSCYSFAEFQQQPTDGGNAIVDDVELDFHIDVNGTKTVVEAGVIFDSYTAGGSEETSTTNNRWDRIRFTGSWGNFTGTPKIKIRVTQNTEGRMYLDETMYAGADPLRAHYPGFVVRTRHNAEFRTLRGNLTTQTIKLPFAGFDGGPFCIVVRYFATDFGDFATGNHTFREDRQILRNPSGGNVAIGSSVNSFAQSITTALAPTYTVNGESIDVTFAGAAYTGANAYLWLEVEYQGSPAMGA